MVAKNKKTPTAKPAMQRAKLAPKKAPQGRKAIGNRLGVRLPDALRAKMRYYGLARERLESAAKRTYDSEVARLFMAVPFSCLAVLRALPLARGTVRKPRSAEQRRRTVAVKLSLGESPMPHEAKGENTLDVSNGDSGNAGVELSQGENESGQDFGL